MLLRDLRHFSRSHDYRVSSNRIHFHFLFRSIMNYAALILEPSAYTNDWNSLKSGYESNTKTSFLRKSLQFPYALIILIQFQALPVPKFEEFTPFFQLKLCTASRNNETQFFGISHRTYFLSSRSLYFVGFASSIHQLLQVMPSMSAWRELVEREDKNNFSCPEAFAVQF